MRWQGSIEEREVVSWVCWVRPWCLIMGFGIMASVCVCVCFLFMFKLVLLKMMVFELQKFKAEK